MEFVVTVLGKLFWMAAGVALLSLFVPQSFPIREHRRSKIAYAISYWTLTVGFVVMAIVHVSKYGL